MSESAEESEYYRSVLYGLTTETPGARREARIAIAKLRVALSTARADALREAADVCESAGVSSGITLKARSQLASAIRSLIPPQEK